MVEENIGRVPVVTDEAYDEAVAAGTARVDDVIGIATRTDVLAAYQGRWEQEQAEAPSPRSTPCRLWPSTPSSDGCSRPARLFRRTSPGCIWWAVSCATCCSSSPTSTSTSRWRATASSSPPGWPLSWAGGCARTASSRPPSCLLPPTILGEAPTWLRSTGEPFHVDVATTRTEFYDYPAALPRVEHASIRQDLFRRDFTINAMAISLRGQDFGTVIDFFGGYRDLREGSIRVLHNLSFIEDPTRIFRAVRYENRYGFRMDEQTKSLRQELRRDAPGRRPVQRAPARRADRPAERGRRGVDARPALRAGSGPRGPSEAGHRGEDGRAGQESSTRLVASWDRTTRW